MEIGIIMIFSAVIVVVIYIVYSSQNSGINIVCSECGSTFNIPVEGEYTCPFCNNDVAYGNHSNIGVVCPSCKKSLFVPGTGTHTCPKCNNDFNYNSSDDKIISKDLPEEFLQFSTDKSIEVQDVYEKIKSSKIKTNLSQKSDKELDYFDRWGLIKDGVKVPNIIVKYFGGQALIDSKGDFYNKDFYFSVNVYNVLFMFPVNYDNDSFPFSLRNKELEYYMLSPDKTMTIISTLEEKTRGTILLSPTAYDVMLKNFPTKDLEYIHNHKIV